MAIHFSFEDGGKAKVLTVSGEFTAGTDANLLLEKVTKAGNALLSSQGITLLRPFGGPGS
jgi:hypothetical protein